MYICFGKPRNERYMVTNTYWKYIAWFSHTLIELVQGIKIGLEIGCPQWIAELGCFAAAGWSNGSWKCGNVEQRNPKRKAPRLTNWRVEQIECAIVGAQFDVIRLICKSYGILYTFNLRALCKRLLNAKTQNMTKSDGIADNAILWCSLWWVFVWSLSSLTVNKKVFCVIRIWGICCYSACFFI